MTKPKQRASRSRILYRLGLLPAFKFLTRNQIRFTAVHGVMGGETAGWRPIRWQLDPDVLREQLQILTRHFEFIDCDEAADMLTGKIPQRPNCVVFTIDDGYVNSLTQALPVLKEFGVRPVIFVATGMIDSELPYWFDRLDLALQASRDVVDHVDIGGERVDVDATDAQSLAVSCRAIIQASRRVFADDRDRLNALKELIASLHATAGSEEQMTDEMHEWIGVMSREQVLDCIAEGATIGSHSVHHVRLPFVSADVAREELVESKRALEAWTGIECRTFCYPEGAVSEEVAKLTKEAGYEIAFTVQSQGRIFHRDNMRLHRFHLPKHASELELVAIVCGLRDALFHLKSRIKSLLGRGSSASADQQAQSA